VTFVDTWKEFHPLEAEYVVHEGEVDEAVARPNIPTKLVPIAQELILESDRLLVLMDRTGLARQLFQQRVAASIIH
jgi:hypothetical protein